MPPKKNKKDKKVKVAEPEPEPEPEIQISDESIDVGTLNLITDINDEFFSTTNKIIQRLMEAGRNYEASRLKKYVTIIYNLHRKYVEEVKENNMLRPQITTAQAKLRLALEVADSTEDAIEHMKAALTLAWRESDFSLAREHNMQDKLQDIIIKCENLETKDVTEQDDGAEFGPLAKYKNIILRERDRLNAECTDLQKRLQMQRYYSEQCDYINKNLEDSLHKANLRVKVLDSEKQQMDMKIKSLSSSLDEQKDYSVKQIAKMDHLMRELTDVQLKLNKKILDYDRQRLHMEKLRSDNVMKTRDLAKCEEEISDLRLEQRNNEEIIKALRLEDKSKTVTISQLTKRLKKSIQDHGFISTKLYGSNRLNHTLKEDIMRLKNTVYGLEKDVHAAAHKYEELRRVKETLQRERENLHSDIAKMNNNIADLKHTQILNATTIDTLRMDINKMNVKLDEAKIHVAKAEKERDEMAQEMETLQDRIEYYQEQVQLKHNQVLDLTEKLQQKHFALINVRKQLENVHSEKMLLQRSLDTCIQERDNLRMLQTKSLHQINQLSNEVTDNQNKINSLNMQIERLNNEKKELQTEVKNKDALLNALRKDLRDLRNKNESLMNTIAEDEKKMMKITLELEETRKERNLIGLQLVRRNDEIILLKEKFDIMQTALDQGQTQYNQRIADIRLLKAEITNLRTERDCLSRALKSTADMREEIVRLHRCLNQERIKVRALIDDARIPTGVHRWRLLKGTDPNRFELIQKLQILQRRNLQQAIDKKNLQDKVDQLQEMSDALKRTLATMPHKSIKEKLVRSQRVNRLQTKQLRSLKAELALDSVELWERECLLNKAQATLHITQEYLCQQNGKETTAIKTMYDQLARVLPGDVKKSKTAGKLRKVKKVDNRALTPPTRTVSK